MFTVIKYIETNEYTVRNVMQENDIYIFYHDHYLH